MAATTPESDFNASFTNRSLCQLWLSLHGKPSCWSIKLTFNKKRMLKKMEKKNNDKGELIERTDCFTRLVIATSSGLDY